MFNNAHAMYSFIDRIHEGNKHISDQGEVTYSPIYNNMYVPGGDAYILVEGIIFCVHRYFLDQNSQRWQNLVRAPTPDIKPALGFSAANPLPLPFISAKQLASLFWVVYNPQFGVFRANEDEWGNILHAAVILEWENIVDLAEKQWNKLKAIKHGTLVTMS
jgi:hypothetical protein